MSKVKTGQQRRLAKAAEWFVQLSRTSISIEDLHAFRRWRRRPANAEAYGAIERTWEAAGTLGDDADLLAVAARALGKARATPRS